MPSVGKDRVSDSSCTLHESNILHPSSEHLEQFRSFLGIIANTKLRRQISRRISHSDIVQETLLAAHRSLPSFQGRTKREFAGWLKTILLRKLSSALQKHLGATRDARLESPIECTATGRSETSQLASSQPTPSAVAIVTEESESLRLLIGKLPSHYQQVLYLRNTLGLPFHEVANRLQKSPGSVRLIWVRAISRLRSMKNLEAEQD